MDRCHRQIKEEEWRWSSSGKLVTYTAWDKGPTIREATKIVVIFGNKTENSVGTMHHAVTTCKLYARKRHKQCYTGLFVMLSLNRISILIINHLIFYVIHFSIGWKIGVILCHPKKIYLWLICSTSQHIYSAEINHETHNVLLLNICVLI
jgi:hypothetical protein